MKLRTIMRGTAQAHGAGGMHVVAVTGAKAGVGATTITHALAAAYQRTERRTAVLDFQSQRSSSVETTSHKNALLASVGMHDVLTGKRRWQEALRQSSENIYRIGPPTTSPADIFQWPVDRRALAEKLQKLAAVVDVCLLDLGGESHRLLADDSYIAQEVVLVTTPERLAIIDAYAAIKAMKLRRSAATFSLIVNQASDREREAVGRRLQHACSQFLDFQFDEVLATPLDEHLRKSSATAGSPEISEPFVARLSHKVMCPQPRRDGRKRFFALDKK